MPGLGQSAASGAAVTMTGQLVRMVIQIGTVIVLARFVSPVEAGLFTIVMLVVGVSEIFRDFGLSNAAIQSRTLTTAQRDTLFWINTALGVVLTVAAVLIAPVVSAAYAEPALAPLIMGVAVTFTFNGVQTQYRASLTRALQFRALAVIEVASALCGSAVAISVAIAGGGAWALVWQTVVIAASAFVLCLLLGRWIPGRPRRNTGMRSFTRFGWNLVATQMINYLAKNIDKFVISVRMGTDQLGLYGRAFVLLMNPLQQVRAPFSRVAVPVLSRIQDERQRYDDYLVRAQVVLGYTIGPGLAFVAGSSLPFVHVLLGETWIGAAPVLGFLAVAGIFSTLAYVAYWAFITQGLTGALFRFTLVTAGLKIACIVIGSQWGIAGVAAGFALEPVLSWPLAIWWLSRSAPTPVRRLNLGAARLGTLALAGAGASWLASTSVAHTSPWLGLVLGAAATAAVYLAGCAFARVRRDIAEVLGVARLVFLSRIGGRRGVHPVS